MVILRLDRSEISACQTAEVENQTGDIAESEEEEESFEAVEKLSAHGINAGDIKKLQDAGIFTCNGILMQTKKASGIETMAITEAFGEFRMFFDYKRSSRPERIVPIAERFGLDPNAVLDNIVYARAYTHEHQYNLLIGLAAKMSEEPFKVLIVDSITALFRVDFSGRGELAERQQKLGQMLSRLTKIAEEFNVAVFLTNQVIADPGGNTFVADPKKPAGGHVMAHASTVRLLLRKGKGEQRICKVYDSPNLPEAEAISSLKLHSFSFDCSIYIACLQLFAPDF
eukprot:jgi/Mesen1/4681/ME000241S03720